MRSTVYSVRARRQCVFILIATLLASCSSGSSPKNSSVEGCTSECAEALAVSTAGEIASTDRDNQRTQISLTEIPFGEFLKGKSWRPREKKDTSLITEYFYSNHRWSGIFIGADVGMKDGYWSASGKDADGFGSLCVKLVLPPESKNITNEFCRSIKISSRGKLFVSGINNPSYFYQVIVSELK